MRGKALPDFYHFRDDDAFCQGLFIKLGELQGKDLLWVNQ